MSYLVPDFLINPVLRQARRFSRTDTAGDLDPLANQRAETAAYDEVAIEDIAEGVSRWRGLETQENQALGNVSGAHLNSSHLRENGGLDEGLDEELPMADTGISSAQADDENSHAVQLQLNSLRSDSVDVDDDVSDNPSFDLGESLSRMSPAEGPFRRPTQNLSLPEAASRHRSSSLPADDGMSALRQQIIKIQAMNIPAEQKARMMHGLLTQGYHQAQGIHQAKNLPRAPSPASMISQERPTTPGSLSSFIWQINGVSDGPPSNHQHTFHLSPDDIKKTYAPLDPPEADEEGDISPKDEIPILGCRHYKRNVKLQCSTCDRWYTCRLCHDEVEDHILVRQATKNMLCMVCGCAQRAGEFCVECGERTAWYYCGVCKLWDNDPNKNIYHCNDCGICRKGRGLGKDFFHCKTCGVCMSMSVEHSHKCIERVSDCNCPICGEYMFTSPRPVVFMLCGHSIHQTCYYEHMKSSYKCPICSKSTVNMETQFRNLDRAIDNQPMPPQFQDTKAMVSCNDCYAKSAVKYHWLGLKCAICDSYNTAQLSILSDPAVEVPSIESREAETTTAFDFATGEHQSAAYLAPGPTRHRRHSSYSQTPMIAPGLHGRFSPYNVPQRIARSLSPVRGGQGYFHNSRLALDDEADDSGADDGDLLDFWGRSELRSVTSPDIVDNGMEDEEDSDESDSAVDDCDEEGDEEDQFELLGHR